MALDDMLDDRETETGAAKRAAAAGVDAIEALGDALDVLGSDALAFVGDDDMDHRAFGLGADGHRRARRPVAKGIGDEVIEELDDLSAVGRDGRKIRRDPDVQF